MPRRKSKLTNETVKERALRVFKHDALKVAEQLRYGEDTIVAIEESKTEGDVLRALANGRNKL